MAEFETVEQKQLIAKRVPPGDSWKLMDDPNGVVHSSLTETLEAYFQKTSALYAVDRVEVQIEEEPIKEYSFYGEFKQGI